MKILCIGQCSFDLNFSLDAYPEQDSKVRALDFSASFGGPAANAAVLCARWGMESWFFGRAANDDVGRMLKKHLAKESVNTDCFFLEKNAVSPVSSILVNNNTSSRTIINYRKNYHEDSAYKKYNSDTRFSVHLPASLPGEFNAVLTDGHDPAAAGLIDKISATVSVLDAGSYRPATAALFAKMDWPVCSEAFVKSALNLSKINKNDLKQILERLGRKFGNDNAAVTLGARGVAWKEGSNCSYLPAYAVDAIDSSAAGDVFHAAFLCSLVTGLSARNAIARAAAAAAISVTRKGSSASIPSLADTLELISSQQNNHVVQL